MYKAGPIFAALLYFRLHEKKSVDCAGKYAVAIKLFSLFPQWVERLYATGFFPVIARGLRLLFGWIPFSMGDIIYSIVFIYCVRKLVGLMKAIVEKSLPAKRCSRQA